MHCPFATRDGDGAEVVYVVELLDDRLPTDARWWPLDDLGGLADRDLILDALPSEPSRVPWANAGWFQRAERWIQDRLADAGISLTGPIEQLRTWGISTVLRVPTTQGMVYFKAAARLPLFAPEARVTAGLATLYPDRVPTPIAISDEGWMLLPDLGPSLGDSGGDAGEVIAALGALQRRSAADVGALFAMGCLDRRLDRLAAMIQPVMQDALAGLSADEAARLRGFARWLQQCCVDLAGYAIPATLVHGDANLGNVAAPSGDPVFFDWTDACVAHPFIDPIVIAEPSRPDHDTSRDRYLAAWRGVDTPERLQAAYAIAEPLAALHQAISYWTIAQSLEPSPARQLAGGSTYWLRILLALGERSTQPGG